MKKDDEYYSLVQKLKGSKSKRKEFIKCVGRIKESERALKRLNHDRDNKDQESMDDLLKLLDAAIKESK
jgi:hypothetical protein